MNIWMYILIKVCFLIWICIVIYFDKFKLFLYFCLNYIVILGVRLNICIIEFENKRKMGVKIMVLVYEFF